MSTPDDVGQEIVETIRRFVEREVTPVASTLEHRNEYPWKLTERMKELGLFGATIAAEYGGLGLDTTTYAMIVEELCVGWMSLSGILNTHLLLAYLLRTAGTECRQDQDIHFRMTEEPEQMLEQDRAATAVVELFTERDDRGHEKAGAQKPVEKHHDSADKKGRKGQQRKHGSGKDAPDRQRHAHPSCPSGNHL